MSDIQNIAADRIAALESEGMSHSDAVGVAMAEDRGPEHVYPHAGIFCAVKDCPGYHGKVNTYVAADGGRLSDEEYAERLAAANSFTQGMVAGWNAAPQDDLETLAARFERNADDWRAIGGDPDLAASRGRGFASGMAEAWSLAADEIRRVLRRDPDYLDMTDEERYAAREPVYDSDGNLI